ncbi:MAG: DISARM system helicase DrmA [Nannocystaceae bacterium]
MPAADSPTARKHLVRALTADLIGPFDPAAQDDPDHLAQELLRISPSRWYLTGFLANEVLREADDDTADGELGGGDDTDPGEHGTSEPEPKAKRFLPASMGMTVLLRAGTEAVTVRLRYADYVRLTRKQLEALGDDPPQRSNESPQTPWWKRMPRGWVERSVPLLLGQESTVAVPDSKGVDIVARAVPAIGVPGVDDGTLAVSVFVVNRRQPETLNPRDPRRDENYLFQVELQILAPEALVPRPDRHLEHADDEDDRILDLQYREYLEWAVGHGCAATTLDHEGRVVGVSSTWIPRAEVIKVRTRSEPAVQTRMEALAELEDGAAVRAALQALPRAYAQWIDQQAQAPIEGQRRQSTQAVLVTRAREAQGRIEAGIERLATDDEARTAFALANEAMARSQRKRRPDREPSWHLFQLAFVVLNVPGVVDPADDDRETVELIFFPTGGGKTEAYLGVIAFTLLLRRMRGQARPDRGLGVAVLLRYTLRLLTLDQLGRAAAMMCALELLRREQPARLGDDRFAVGLWVGRSASANRLREAGKQVEEYRNRMRESPFPLTNCPWCDAELTRQSLTTRSGPGGVTDIVCTCVNRKGGCEFSSAGRRRDGLPVLFVDEQIYRQLPCFVVATVDKFAMLPWRGETGMMFGKVHSRQGPRFFGPMDSAGPGAGSQALPQGLRPPELIVQDELHLISGPLGTMVGLYETMIEHLCLDRSGPVPRPPKIISATATVRRAHKQIRALFGRSRTRLFPPPGVDAWDTFFAEVDTDANKRLYVGVAAAGRPIKRILINTYLALLAGAEKVYDRSAKSSSTSPPTPVPAADPYMTLVGYFNSLRELGGMRRLVEDEIHTRVKEHHGRRPEDWIGHNPWFARRTIAHSPVELTSREKTADIARHKERLGAHVLEDGHVDVCLASNMISVGVDIDRLGLMVVAGQPKTTSEYIQASSRVGRQSHWPGLVVTVFNLHKPRDRSHYEHFEAYHRSFYRNVESQSLTPFSGPAIDRGYAGTLVGMTRLGETAMTPPRAVELMPRYREHAEAAVEALVERARTHSDDLNGERLSADLRRRGMSILDSWQTILETAAEGSGSRSYSPFDDAREGKALLRTFDDTDNTTDHEQKFEAPTSMRDVESTVHIWVDRSLLLGGG